MNIDQYHRRETMQPAGSGSITLAPNISTQGEIGRLGNILTDIGFGLEQMRLDTQYETQKNKAILEAKKGFLDVYENLDPNDTDSWEASLEEYQKTLDNIKVTNGRAMRELPTIFEDMKLEQRKSIISYRNSVDMRNFQRDYRANYETSMILAAKAPSRPEFEGEVIDTMQNIFGLEKIDPDKPITRENIRRMEGYKNSMLLSEKTSKSEFFVWLNDAELAYESEQRERTMDQFQQQAVEDPQLFLAVMEDFKQSDLPETMRDDSDFWDKLKTFEKAVRKSTEAEEKIVYDGALNKLKGDVYTKVFTDPRGALTEAQAAYEKFDPEDVTTMIDNLTDLASDIANTNRKEPTPQEIVGAVEEIEGAKSPKEKLQMIAKYGHLFSDSWVAGKSEEAISEMQGKTPQIDSVLKEGLERIDKIRDTYLKTLEEPDDLSTAKEKEAYFNRRAEMEMKFLKRKQDVEDWFKNNKDAPIDQKNKQIEAALAPLQEDVAKDVVDKWYSKRAIWNFIKTGGLTGKYYRQLMDADDEKFWKLAETSPSIYDSLAYREISGPDDPELAKVKSGEIFIDAKTGRKIVRD